MFQTKNPPRFGKMTQDNIGKRMGIFLDKKYVSAPTIQSTITSDGEITGQFTEDDTIRISNELNAGALPVPVLIIENDTVGPLLGKQDLEKSLWASIVGLGIVLLFMIWVYRLPGFLADIALLVYVLMLLGLLSAVHAVLTLPGIAGFVLSIGMAVDANVLIFERLKEELCPGRQDLARCGAHRVRPRVLDRVRQPLYDDRRRRRAVHARNRHREGLRIHALLGHRILDDHCPFSSRAPFHRRRSRQRPHHQSEGVRGLAACSFAN